IYLWHQTAMIAVTVLTLRISGGVPMTGLHTAPDLAWLGARLAWLPIFAGALWLILRLWRSPRVAAPAPTGGCTLSGVRRPDDREEVIAVQDGDPPSRGRAAARQPA
ncbi:MAG TPA: hypothetical protein VES42_17070, partial [Pilimelia sp.]|nr:hypothetical protein [Pilimelia sp.]